MNAPNIPLPSKLDDTLGFDAAEPKALTIYQCDFPRIGNLPQIEGQEIKVRRSPHPARLDREHTYWHMVSKGDEQEGADESLREPDITRLVRISWAKPLLLHYLNPTLKRWREVKYGLWSVYVWHPKVNYLIVLRERSKELFLTTTYCPESIIKYHNKWSVAKKAGHTF